MHPHIRFKKIYNLHLPYVVLLNDRVRNTIAPAMQSCDYNVFFPSKHKDLALLSQKEIRFHDTAECKDVISFSPYSLMPHSTILILFA